ncbi:hypothetical protein F7R91_00235 [Streptomyces luteolifulvus]|uniref:Low molecular weight antigen MTB12-like C-terminal domain-containing protein n=1 Tax=Streptomyces luteolifulvus TaxID=2615112 RepID=A0A6H9V8L1_9ACTN|nr:hypothetical protein [Streptomyces luteolifulvus]KAB1150860.1 hypothetical protein F7R91_00235 [Streptomyces luteolifulvus]
MVLGSDLRRGKARRGRGPGAAGRGTAVLAALALFLAPALAACSDDNGGGSESTPPAPTPETTTSAPATAPADPAAAQQEIRQNWQKFFDPASSTQEKLAVLENGEQMGPVLQAFSGDQRGGQVQAKVTKVEFTGPTRATVTYTLTLKGATALPNASGTAVEQQGTWKVSVNTLCSLVQLSGNGSPAPGC